MKTESTEYLIRNLVSMTDFVLIRSNEPALKDCPAEIRTIHRYAEFLQQPLKLEMFVPIDSDGFFCEEPNHKDFLEADDFVNNGFFLELNDYEKALNKILFKGFSVLPINPYQDTNFENLIGHIVPLTNGEVMLPFIDNANMTIGDFIVMFNLLETITVEKKPLTGKEDLKHGVIILTDTALKQIFGHAGY
ncbi:hypothetical protein [Flavobacterium sp. CAU 1735]|uniref:hypothetical protein n=1 Tax=Flavobacterium sp. CAU 1735 TaxID=3140361 RepID=UPI003260DF50